MTRVLSPDPLLERFDRMREQACSALHGGRTESESIAALGATLLRVIDELENLHKRVSSL